MNKTIGNRLKEKRLSLNYTLEKVSDELKIRPEFLKAIEEDNYSIFASDIYAKGFIKSYSKYLGLDSENFTAVYRRDIQGSKLSTQKHKDLQDRDSSKKIFFFNRQKFKYLALVLFVTFIIFAILNLLNKAFEPPTLELISPTTLSAGATYQTDYYDKTVRLTGKTNPNTVIKINGIVVPAKTDNTFESDLYAITLDTNQFLVEAISNVGVISRIQLTLNKKTNILEQASGINGALQVIKDNSLIKITIDDTQTTNAIFFENDSIPIIAKKDITIEADKPENIKIILNGEEYKLIGTILKLTLVDNKLQEVN